MEVGKSLRRLQRRESCFVVGAGRERPSEGEGEGDEDADAGAGASAGASAGAHAGETSTFARRSRPGDFNAREGEENDAFST